MSASGQERGRGWIAMACVYFVEEPFKDDLDPRLLRARGGRDCPGGEATLIRCRIRHDRRWWPDRTLAEEAENLPGTVHLNPSYVCPGNSRIKVFTEIIVKGLKNKSDRVRLPCGD